MTHVPVGPGGQHPGQVRPGDPPAPGVTTPEYPPQLLLLAPVSGQVLQPEELPEPDHARLVLVITVPAQVTEETFCRII